MYEEPLRNSTIKPLFYQVIRDTNDDESCFNIKIHDKEPVTVRTIISVILLIKVQMLN